MLRHIPYFLSLASEYLVLVGQLIYPILQIRVHTLIIFDQFLLILTILRSLLRCFLQLLESANHIS